MPKKTIEIDFYSSVDFPAIGEVIEKDGTKYKVIKNLVRNVTTLEEVTDK